MLRLTLLFPLCLLVLGCGSNGGSSNGDLKCEIGGDASKARLVDFDEAKTNRLVVQTNKGSFTIELDTEASPCATASVAGLAQDGFFDGLPVYRVQPSYEIVLGEPLGGHGWGGPGYWTVDDVPADARYTKGVAAMDRTPQDPPGVAGSRFFIVTAADLGLDPPEYAILGEVVEGLDVVERIGRLGLAGCSACRPTEHVVIDAMWLRSGS